LLLPFRRCQDRCTVVFYDHRCNGGSPGRSRLVHDLGEPEPPTPTRRRLGFEWFPIFGRIGGAYYHRFSPWRLAYEMLQGEWRTKYRPEPLIFAGRHLLRGWAVMDWLGEITVSTLVLAGRGGFVFRPECQLELAAGIANAWLRIIERAGHHPHSERPDEVMQAVGDFLSTDTAVPAGEAPTTEG
jgi:pimeloyl-ACP methyl ester carboxylesterase